MAQLSRPFQIVLVVFGLFVAVWFVALRGHSSSTSGSGSGSAPAASAPAPSSAAPAAKAPAPSTVYKGAAPGVAGLTRAIDKAHGAVAASQQNANKLEQQSSHASSATPPAAAGQATRSPASPAATPAGPTVHAHAKTSAPSVHKQSAQAQGTASKPTTEARQRMTEAELKQGKIVVLLFWNPKGADDVTVHNELQALARRDRAKTAVHEAPAAQVATFGSITRGVQVYGTPTILIVNKRGQASSLTGLQDAYAIEQAISEARHA